MMRHRSRHHRRSKDSKSAWIDLAAWIVTRVVWFAIGFVPAFFILMRESAGPHPLISWGRPVLIAAVVIGALAAAFGPSAFQEETERGRGCLAETRRASKGLASDDAPGKGR